MRRVVAGALALGLVVVGLSCGRDVAWWSVRTLVALAYRDVARVSPVRVAAEVAVGGAAAPLLVDVRTAAEFAVSHLSGARRVEPGADPRVALADVDPARPVVVYCAVGVRSARLARRLRAAGWDDVRNLDGAIFGWARAGRPLVAEGGAPTSVVHPYGGVWRLLVPPPLRASVATPVSVPGTPASASP